MKLGTRVRIADGSGLLSGRLGVVIAPGKVDGRGVPLLDGHYKPIQRTGALAEEWIRLGNGEIVTMFRRRLIAIKPGEYESIGARMMRAIIGNDSEPIEEVRA